MLLKEVDYATKLVDVIVICYDVSFAIIMTIFFFNAAYAAERSWNSLKTFQLQNWDDDWGFDYVDIYKG